MDYDDNDLHNTNLHLAGEGNNKFPPVLCPYALPRFDFDDNLHGDLRFDSLAETDVFLGIESSDDNQWIEDFSRGSTGIAFSSSAAEPCSISRCNNVWSEAASSESVEMLLKSVGQDESILSQTISKDSDACDELGGGVIKLMEPNLKPGDSDLTEVGDALQPASQTGEIPGKFYGLKGDVSRDQLVDSVSQMQESKAPNTSNADLSVRDESKDGEQIVVSENQVEASVDQCLDNREQVNNFTSVQDTCESSKDSDACDELGNVIKQMEPNLKHGDSGPSEVGDCLQLSLRTDEIPGKFSGLKGDDVSGDNLLVQDVSSPHEFDSSVDGTLKVPNTRSIDLPERDDKDENQVETSVDQFVDNREQLNKFSLGSQVDTSIFSVQNTCASSVFLESQDTTHLKNDTIDENVDSLAGENVDLSQEIHIDGENLIENAVASVTSDVQKHSVSNMQPREDGCVTGNITPTMGEPSNRTLKENSNHTVEECSEGLAVESPLPTGISNVNVLSVGKLHDISPMPFLGDTTIKEQESEIGNIDTQISVIWESKLDNLDSMVQIACDAPEKNDLSESDCHSNTKIMSSKSEKYLSSVEDGKGYKGEGDGAHNTLGAEPVRVDEDFIVTEHTDDSKFEQSVSAAEKQNTKLPSHCIKTDREECGSLVVIKRVDSSSFGTSDTANELASNLLSDVAISGKLVDCMLVPSDKNLLAAAVSNQKDVQVSSPEASFSIIKTSGISIEGAPCETGWQSSCKKDDQSLSMEDASNAVGQSGEPTLGVTLESKDMDASSIVSDSTVRETYDAEVQVISRGSSGPSGAVSIQDKNKTLTNSVPSTSKELLLNADEKHPEDSDPKLSQEFSGHIVAHHADGDNAKTHNSSFPSAPSSEPQTKTHMKECGSNAYLDNPSCGSPILIRTSEQPESNTGTNTVKGSKDLSALVSGVVSEEANKEHSISQDTKGNDAFSGDRNFTFEVLPMASLSEKEAGKNWQPFSKVQLDKISLIGERTPSISASTKVGPETAEEVSRSNVQTSKRENVSGGSKGTSARRTRRAGSQSIGKKAAKKGIVAKDRTPARQSKRGGKTSKASLSTAENDRLVKSNEMQHFGHMEGDSQQVQLRAQIFVYGALIQGTAPDEAYMISAFGGPDGRTIWEKAWGACMDRVHSQKSHPVSPETPLQAHIGAKTPDQSIKETALQTKITSSPASQSSSRGATTSGKPRIPLSTPLWAIPTPSGDALQPASIPRGAVVDYRQGLSPLHSPVRNFVGHNAPWVSQFPFCAPWVPHSSAFDSNACFPELPITEAVNLTPVRDTSVPNSSVMKQVSTVPTVQSGGPANVFAGIPLLDNKKATSRSSQSSADPKPRKRKKSVSEDPGQIILHSQAESVLATVVNSHASTPADITTPYNFITSVSGDHIKKDDRNSDQKATLSKETLGKLKEAQKQAEDAGALSSTVVSRTQEIWNQLEKRKNSVLTPDVETKLTSAAVTIAAAAAVAKAAAAAASVASNAALQAKLMADEAWVSSGYRNPTPTNTISFDSVNLGKATPASILRGEDVDASSNSVIAAAKEASRRRVEAASAASKQAENMDAIVKAAELAAEAVSQAGKIVMGGPFRLAELVEAGPVAYWKVPHASSEPDGAVREHSDKGGNVEAPGSVSEHPQEVPTDKSEKHSNLEVSPILRDMDKRLIQDDSRLTDGILGAAAISGNDKKDRKVSDIAKSKGVSTKTEHGKEEETLKDGNMREGSHVEVLRDGGGSKVAWFPADILDLKDGKAYVCYNELRSEDGDRLKEWVELEGERDKEPRIRSGRPIAVMPFERTRKRRRAAMGDYNWSIGDRVDAWMQDSWWEGVISERSKNDETSYTVRFPAQGETSIVKAWLLRPSLIWKNGNWVEWYSLGDNNGSSLEGDTPLQKRSRINSPVIDTEEEGTKGFDHEETKKPDGTRLLDFPVGENLFSIGKCNRDESKPGSQRMKRSGLKKEGSRVIFGVPKPGKKRKFMEVSKHYVTDRSSRTHETSDSAKFAKSLIPCGSEHSGTKHKIEPKEKGMAVSKSKVLKSGKPPSVSSRTIPQKDSLSSNVDSEPDDAESISGEHTMEFRSVSSSDGAAEGPVLFSSVAASSDAPREKASISNAKSERISKGKLAPASGKLAKVEEETKTVSDAVERRRSNRKIQPTSRLLEGLQSSLLISKVPVPHDKGQRSARETSSNESLGVPLELRRHLAGEEQNHAQAKEHQGTDDRHRDRLPLRSRPDEHMLVA
ncbi:Detected protein of confused Function [Hibiscus syriacus]|uniref:Detected protein of confused Function n=1 Tax=Hibiscus syriacus TaxID=106335 RepID=A0A6A3C5B0_HIBSY|nr:Detected protein of confused Function [Hibiscus syriacus]